jgi:uncharacterized protein
MHLHSNQLIIKRSLLPGAGNGLFTKTAIAKGTRIIEYKGKIRKWKDIKNSEADNPYLMYVTSNHVIDAGPLKSAKARYANDAKGFNRINSIKNNATYEKQGNRIFIKAMKNIPAGAEVLVGYGKEYWDTMHSNNLLDKKKDKR